MSNKVTLESYLKSHENYFWEYQEEGSIVSFQDGHTIAYFDYIKEVLFDLQEIGFPPFGSLLLTLYATSVDEENLYEQIKYHFGDDEIPEILFTLSDLPKQYKTGKNRLLVLRTIFEDAHNKISAYTTQRILKSRSLSASNWYSQPTKTDDSKAVQAVSSRDLGCLISLSKKYKTVDDILNQIAGLVDVEEDVVVFEETNATTTTSDGDFVDDLINNSHTFEVGALVPRIWSGLSIPVHSSASSVQPLGGVSDIANKGDFDKLLISEFAYDDISFLSRLANNESLYIQKEIPPSKSKHERYILLDATLKNWGTPKTLAMSTMLAIAQHPKSDYKTSVYVIGEKATPIEIETVNDIIAAVKLVEPGLHASQGLVECIKLLPKNGQSEIILITEKSNLLNQAFAKQLTDSGNAINYLITTERSGGLDVYKRTKNSRKHVQHIHVPLEQIWNEKRPKYSPKEKHTDEHSEDDVPILWGQQKQYKKMFMTLSGEQYFISNTRCLYRSSYSSKERKGLIRVKQNLQIVHGEYAMSDDEILLMYNPHTKKITLLDLKTNKSIVTDFPHYEVNTTYTLPNFFYRENAFWHTHGNNSWSIAKDGILTHHHDLESKALKEAAASFTKLPNKVGLNKSFLKKIPYVSIDSYGKLSFGNHILILINDLIKLEHFSRVTAKVFSQKDGEDFVFADGSRITVLTDGMIKLTSSDPAISPFWIPMVLDSYLGTASHHEFAGYTYYKKHTTATICLQDVGPNKLAVVKAVKMQLECGLKKAHEMILNAPCTFTTTFENGGYGHYISELRKCGATVELVTYTVDQETITPSLFYDRYIQPFIYVIEKHAANS